MPGLTENAGHEFDRHEIDEPCVQALNLGHEIGGHYINMQRAILFKTTAKHKSQQQSKLRKYMLCLLYTSDAADE